MAFMLEDSLPDNLFAVHIAPANGYLPFIYKLAPIFCLFFFLLIISRYLNSIIHSPLGSS